MNKKFWVLILFTLALPCFAWAKTPERIFYMNGSRQAQAIASIKKNYKKIDILAPQSYVVTSNLKLSGGLSTNLKKVIKAHKIKTMPLVANNSFSQKTIHNLLLAPSSQDLIIASLISVAKQEKYIGFQYDFENISYLDRDLYSAFIEKTAKEFKKNNLIFSVAVITRQTDYQDSDAFKNWGGVFDYKRIANVVDFISIMTYDDPNSVGPVASIPFIKNCLDYVKDKIPAEKLSLGIPLYYWAWDMSSSKKINIGGNYDRLLDIMANNKCQTGFDASLGTAWMAYFLSGKQYAFWFTDKKTAQMRIDLIKEYNLRGFSAWLLGVEDPAIWQVI